MAPQWDLAAVIVAIIGTLLAMSPASLSLVRKISRAVIGFLFPASAQCERLGWSEVPEGILHECSIPLGNCLLVGAPGTIRSWDVTIGSLFTRIRRGTYVRKPKQLDINTTYVRTDVETLKALLCILNPQTAEEQNLFVVYKQIDNILTAYFKLRLPLEGFPPVGHCIDLTKHEMKCMFKGYPPWYKKHMLLANGERTSNPIQEADDVARGGWIVAVGLSPECPFPYHFMSRDTTKEEKWAVRRKYTSLTKAFKRVVRALDNIIKVFPEEHNVILARAIIHIKSSDLLENGILTENVGYRLIIESDDGYDQYQWAQCTELEYARDLTTEQCRMIMNAFSHYQELSDVEVSGLRPILMVVLRAIMVGSYRVLRYFQLYEGRDEYKDFTKSVRSVPERCSSNAIYLRDRPDDDED